MASQSAGDARTEILAGMQRAGIAMTAENYALLQEYHLGGEPTLRRALDNLIATGRGADQVALTRLYKRFCAAEQEAAAFRDIARRALATLRDAATMIGDMQDVAEGYGSSLATMSNGLEGEAGRPDNQAALRQLVQRLAADTSQMLRRSDVLARRLSESGERIHALEHCLDEARQEAATDPLTGLANRRSFNTALAKAVETAMTAGAPLSLLLADIDHFKRVNDSHGHDAGDEVLRTVANAIRQAVRGRDLIARFGGEEFAVILRDTNQRGAVIAAENIRQLVAATMLDVPGTPLALNVTVSLGVSSFEPGEKSSAFIKRADLALYRAKAGGRNRTAV